MSFAFTMNKNLQNIDKERLETIKRHIENSPANKYKGEFGNMQPEEHSAIPKHRQDIYKWNGWGYKDSQFVIQNNHIFFTGSRYPISNKKLPALKKWVEDNMGLDENIRCESQTELGNDDIPKPNINDEFLCDIESIGIEYSLNGRDRLFRAHGQSLSEVWTIREGMFDRIPDLVVFPRCHDDVEKIVTKAVIYNVVIIPYGGGTNVTAALECPSEETRMIVSLDTSQMCRILWVDPQNLTICAEAGITGVEMEQQLEKYGLCMGHEPDSWEISTLGGWVATRASGMKKATYGNIEDLLVHVRFVTTHGILERNCQVPRLSSGPDMHHIILGSEGTLGVVTEVTLKVRPLPETQLYGSILFPNFETGAECLREIARQKLQPTSIRLMDNKQFIFGHALKAEDNSFLGALKSYINKLFITKIKGFDVNQMCVATILLEGKRNDIEALEKQMYALASKYGGYPGGEQAGKDGYILTYVIAYIRDVALDYGVLSDSFETSVPWDRVTVTKQNVESRISRELEKYGIKKNYFVSCRLTQSYDAGACLYFYLSFNHIGIEDPVTIFDEVEAAARDEIMDSGGSISHHHGVGKLRKQFVLKSISDVGVGMLKSVKNFLDPNNIFANGNLIP